MNEHRSNQNGLQVSMGLILILKLLKSSVMSYFGYYIDSEVFALVRCTWHVRWQQIQSVYQYN